MAEPRPPTSSFLLGFWAQQTDKGKTTWCTMRHTRRAEQKTRAETNQDQQTAQKSHCKRNERLFEDEGPRPGKSNSDEQITKGNHSYGGLIPPMLHYHYHYLK